MAEIADGQVEREVDREQDQHQQVVPADHAGHEGQGATGALQRQGGGGVSAGGVPVAGGEAAVHRAEGEEDEEEEHVGAQAGDQVDEAEDAHPQQEEGEGREEGRVGEADGGILLCRRVGAVRVIGWRQRRPEREPVRAVGAEDDEGEGVAEHEFEEAAGEHEETAEEEVGAAVGWDDYGLDSGCWREALRGTNFVADKGEAVYEKKMTIQGRLTCRLPRGRRPLSSRGGHMKEVSMRG